MPGTWRGRQANGSIVAGSSGASTSTVRMSGPPSPHRAVAIGIALALHLLSIWLLTRANFVTVAARFSPRELPITLWLTLPQKSRPAIVKHQPPTARAQRRQSITPPPGLMPRGSLNGAIWQGIGQSLACGNIGLSPQQRERCKHQLVAMPGPEAQTRALIVKAPHSDALTPAEQRLHEMRTQDPCFADETAHLPFCIYRIIYGNKGP